MIVLLLKASFILLILWAFYRVVLLKESFFSQNRVYLLSCLLLIFVLPFISLPKVIHDQGIISSAIEQMAPPLEENTNPGTLVEVGEADEETDPIESKTPETVQTAHSSEKGIIYWLLWIYFFGLAVFTLRFFSQLISLCYKIFKSEDKISDTDCTIICSTQVKEPCSFFNYIFINPESYDYDTYEQILQHEKIHVKKWHSIDLLLAELAVTVLWFNPMIWVLRKEVERNLEYQTDDLLLHHGNDTDENDNQAHEEREAYQMNLLRIATNNRPLTVTTNYNQSLIKQRILKMNSKKSNPHSYWKYAFIIPLILTVLVILNKPSEALAHLSKNETRFINELLVQEGANAEEYDEVEAMTGVWEEGDLTDKEDRTLVSSTDCDELEKVAKTGDEEKVRKVLLNYHTDCLQNHDEEQVNNIKAIKLLAKTDAEIIIDDQTGSIEVIADLLRFRLDSEEEFDNDELGFINCFDHEPLRKAIKQENELLTKQLIRDLDAEDLLEQNDEFIETLDLMKSLVDKNANLSFDKISFYLLHDEEEGEDCESCEEDDFEEFDDRRSDVPDQPCEKLVEAILDEDIEEVSRLLKEVDVNCFVRNPGYEIVEHGQFKSYRQKPRYPLEAAARIGNVPIGKLLFSNGADMSVQSRGRALPIITAASFGNTEFIRYLVTLGAKVNGLTSDEGTPLIAAASHGHLETVKYLLSEGAKIDVITSNQGNALIAAANNGHIATVKYLIAQGVALDVTTSNQGSAVIAAANNGHTETVKYLLDKGAEIDVTTSNQGSAVIAAATNGHIETVRYLLNQGASVNATTPNQGSALIAAANNGHTETVRYLLDQGAKVNLTTSNQGTALIAAANNGHLQTVSYLLGKGAKISLTTPNQGSALISAANNGHLKTVQFLLDQGAEIDAISPNQGTALIAASRNGHLQTVQYLLSQGAEVDLLTDNQGSALSNAVGNRHYLTAKILLENGADPYLKSNNQGYPLYYARNNNDGRMIKLLKKYAKED